MQKGQSGAPHFQLTDGHVKRLAKSGASHKYNYGHAVIVSGPAGQGGAARLAARGALRVGAGLVSVLCPPDALPEHAAQLNTIMVKPFGNDQPFAPRLTALKPSAICIGPNLGLTDADRAQVAGALSLDVPICLDADAITLIAQEADLLQSAPQSQIVLTPHEGELRRLIPDAFAETSCRVTLAKTAARALKCVVLYKGADTVVAGPDDTCTIVPSGGFPHAPWLATAGSGDVLSGIITGLMARGFEAFDAAALGAHLHLECSEIIGAGLIAEDIPETLPRVLTKYFTTVTSS